MPSAVGAALGQPVLSLGGGPAFDLAGLALLSSFHALAAAPPKAAAASGPERRDAGDACLSVEAAASMAEGVAEEAAAPPAVAEEAAEAPALCVHVLDYERRWAGAAAAVCASVNQVLGTRHRMHFGVCDVTAPLHR